jgi:molybdate transport system substrate-binding protein
MKIVVVIFILLFALSAAGTDLPVFAAASLTEALSEIAAKYESETRIHVLFNFGASSLLARQIAEGSPAAVFFSADEEKMDALQRQGLILNETRKSLLSNTLVIVIPIDSNVAIKNPQDLAKSNWKIALAETTTVPAGIYAKQYLDKIGLWSQVKDRVIPAGNVRAALAAVESGNVDVGIVYKTDATISKRVKIAYEIPAKETPGISYPVAVLRETENVNEAKKFVEYLASQESRNIFKKYGFIVL